MNGTQSEPKASTWRPNRLWYGLVAWIAHRVYFASKGGVEGSGLENVPVMGATIIAPVHFSNLDPPAVASVCPRQLRFMAKQELFKGFFGWAIASVGAFPVKRGENDTDAIRKALAMLDDGQAVLLFPEGERGDGERLGPINRGVAMLAKRSGAQVVPTAVIGTHSMLPRGAKGAKRGHVHVVFGAPFSYADVALGTNTEARAAFAAELESRLLSMCEANGLRLMRSSVTSAEVVAD
ncbi:MAG: lysophospholipid acyltransferase family protein [Fimbriimonadaceae bacterium]